MPSAPPPAPSRLSSDDAVATLVSARTLLNVSSPRANAARIAGSSCNASATRRNSRASRPVIPQRHARKACRSLLSPCSCISQTSSSQRAVAALRCADRLASSSTRCSVAASRAATPSRTLSINVVSIENRLQTGSDGGAFVLGTAPSPRPAPRSRRSSAHVEVLGRRRLLDQEAERADRLAAFFDRYFALG